MRFLLFLLTFCGTVGAFAQQPNIIFILVDDLGYGDLGCFHQDAKSGNKFDTPLIDSMAAEGMKLTHHYISAPVCAPSRASLLTGRHQGHCAIRNSQFDKALPLNHNVANMLKELGYYTAIVGKHGLAGGEGGSIPSHPLLQGFDHFFGYLHHGDGHEHYPRNGTTDKVAFVYDDFTAISNAYADVYTTDLWTARAKKVIVDEQTNNPNRPFFIYLAYDTPHFKMQYPPIAYPSGLGVSGGVQWTGAPSYCNTALNITANINAFVHPDHASTSWPTSNKQHAGMIRRIDDGVGDILQTLKDLGIDDETLVVFTSDNGPHNEGNNPRFFESFANMDGIKRDIWEAGIRVPTIAWWPTQIATNSVQAFPCAIWDWMPTFADMAGSTAPAWCDGVSLLPSLTGSGNQREKGYLYFEFNHSGNTPNWGVFESSRQNRARGEMQAIRIGNYMGVRTSTSGYRDPFEIYDVVNDAKQATNLSASSAFFDELQVTLQDRSMHVRRPGAGVTRPYDSENIPPVNPLVETGLTYAAYEGSWSWVPEFADLTPVQTGPVSEVDLSVRSRDNDIGLMFSGYIDIAAAGVYAFYVRSDSGANVWIHDAQVIDDDYHHDGSEVSGSINLDPGLHPIRVYYQHANAATHQLDLQYSGTGIIKQPIPGARLFRDGIPPPEPVARADILETPQNIPGLIEVLANDMDDGGITNLTIISAGPALNGTVVITNQQVQFTPETDFLGETEFDYVISDGTYLATAAVTVVVFHQDPQRIWMPFNEGEGLTTREVGGRSLGMLTGYPGPQAPWVTGRFSYAPVLDGSSQFVALDASYHPPSGASDRTITAWIKTAGRGAIVSWGVKTGARKWHFRLEDGTNPGALRIEVEGGFKRGTTDLRDDQWHHVALVFENDGSPNVTDCLLYVDGVLDTTGGETAQTINTADTPVTIGVDSQNRYFPGLIDELKIYDRALTALEIQNEAMATHEAEQAWHIRHFGNAAIDWLADDDGDDRSRLAEYAFGGLPYRADQLPGLVIRRNGTTGRLEISTPQRSPSTHGLIYQLEETTNYQSWSDLNGTKEGTSPLSLTHEWVTDSVDADGEQKAIRARVNLAP